jgi:hypothetical protein
VYRAHAVVFDHLHKSICRFHTISMMPHATKSGFDYIRVKPLAPTFGAEVTGVDFSKPVPSKVFAEIHRAITQVS